MVYKLALSQMKNTANAEDICQDVFCKFLQKGSEIRNEASIKAWLIRVTINSCKSIFRSGWFKKTVPLEEELEFDQQEKSDVYYAMLELPQKYRAVIHLFYYEELTVREIAEVLQVKESTVRSQLHRGRELLKELLKGGYEDVSGMVQESQ
ncbi:MAG TPA: sigma-70 family RNA polymerase sigma factor [Candidatus Avimonoglobus intestinipullorum]|uniref:Sigma-70 family RNA polymerase sigma factor n=1 Tax=Candidatus Avimonoglobus intestinipullorum TaxID=2840699 RepID=A0A9D1LVX2_9FIRM|nr:sigma-70 family RNA polymerase sigma factor [Candidatus Avimonoglobus intestinipullorum]